MVKKALWLLLLAAAAFAAWRFGYSEALKYFFRTSGTVSAGSALLSALPGPNAMLFVVARNDSGVPVAVKKIINPVFPVKFEMTSESLIMPDLLTRKIYMEALLNTHGQLGTTRKGDLKGGLRGRVTLTAKNLDIVLDKVEK